MSQRKILKYAMKKSGQRKSREINRKLMKEEFIVYVIILPISFIFIFNIVGFIFEGILFWIPFIAFPVTLIMWSIVHIGSFIEEKRIEKELGWK